MSIAAIKQPVRGGQADSLFDITRCRWAESSSTSGGGTRTASLTLSQGEYYVFALTVAGSNQEGTHISKYNNLSRQSGTAQVSQVDTASVTRGKACYSIECCSVSVSSSEATLSCSGNMAPTAYGSVVDLYAIPAEHIQNMTSVDRAISSAGTYTDTVTFDEAGQYIMFEVLCGGANDAYFGANTRYFMYGPESIQGESAFAQLLDTDGMNVYAEIARRGWFGVYGSQGGIYRQLRGALVTVSEPSSASITYQITAGSNYPTTGNLYKRWLIKLA